jgi:hypothetical protein
VLPANTNPAFAKPAVLNPFGELVAVLYPQDWLG